MMTENEVRQMEVETEWNGKANVCIHCGKVPETYYIATGHDHTDDSIRYCFCQAQAQSFEQLQAKNAELAAEVERWKTISVCEACAELPAVFQYIEGMEKQLAIAEEHNARLKDALRHCCYSLAQVTGPAKMSCDYARWKADQALSIPASREALDKYVAEKVKELFIPVRIDYGDGDEDVAFGNDHQVRRLKKWLDKFFAQKQQISELTRQRDLVISALAILAQHNSSEPYVEVPSAWITSARKILSAIKESEV